MNPGPYDIKNDFLHTYTVVKCRVKKVNSQTFYSPKSLIQYCLTRLLRRIVPY